MNTTSLPLAVMFLRARTLGIDGSERQIEATQIAWQRHRCQAAAVDLNCTIIREYIEHGGAGGVERRPVLRLMLDEIRALRDVKYVLVASLDRLTRANADWHTLQLEFEAAGVTLVNAGGAADGMQDRSLLRPASV